MSKQNCRFHISLPIFCASVCVCNAFQIIVRQYVFIIDVLILEISFPLFFWMWVFLLSCSHHSLRQHSQEYSNEPTIAMTSKKNVLLISLLAIKLFNHRVKKKQNIENNNSYLRLEMKKSSVHSIWIMNTNLFLLHVFICIGFVYVLKNAFLHYKK